MRAPFGEPLQVGGAEEIARVAPILARHGVHVGWNVDSFDYDCPTGDGDCVYERVTQAIGKPGAGSYGVVLMHAVHSQTVNALGRIIDYARGNGFQIWTVEQVVMAKYGKSSRELIGLADPTAPAPAPAPGPIPPQMTPMKPPTVPSTPAPAPPACNAPAYAEGVRYLAGDRVQNGGQIFACKAWPYGGWCGAGAEYAPGVGWAWRDAWDLVQSCK